MSLLLQEDAVRTKERESNLPTSDEQMFAKQLGITMEVYVDDMLVKSLTAVKHVSDLQATFDIILAYGMRLNPEKCLFGAVKGKFFSHVISR